MKNFNQYLLSLITIALISSCSGGGGGNDKGQEKTHSHQNSLEADMYGIYQAILSPVNQLLSFTPTGSLTLVRDKNEFVADLRLSDSTPSLMHIQQVHVGDRCPSEQDDLNLDGYIDAMEGALVYKGIFIPLDEDLNSQRMGGGIFPMTNEYGHYLYSQAANWDKFVEDIKEEDINPDDDILKLSPEKPLKVDGKVVVVFGVSSSVELPETVEGRGRLTKHQGLPIACGVIRKLTTTPGTIDNDTTDIPVPDGETIGGSGGADDGTIFISSGTTTGGNYGDTDEDASRL